MSFRDFRWIDPYVEKKIRPNENYIVRKVNTNNTQILHQMRLRKLTTETSLENINNNEKFRPDDAIVVSRVDLNSTAGETELDPSTLDCPTVYRDPVTTEPTNSRNVVTQPNIDEHSSQRLNDASDVVNDEPQSQKHSSQDHVNTPQTDLLNDIDACNENDGTSKPCRDIKFWYRVYS